MDQRGQKSAENLVIVGGLIGQRPDPPEKLSEVERAVWKRIVATKPPEWFTAENQPLLVEYCRAIVHADQLAETLAECDGVPSGDDLTNWLKLRDRQDKTARLLTTLATKMRLTQQSRWNAKTADTGHRRTGQQERKPWEFGKGDAG